MPEIVTVPLSRPIRAQGQDVTALDFRQPSAGDLMDCGFPYGGEDGGKVDTAAVGNLISRLANVPLASVRTMGSRDFLACLKVIGGFLSSSEEAPGSPGTTGNS